MTNFICTINQKKNKQNYNFKIKLKKFIKKVEIKIYKKTKYN